MPRRARRDLESNYLHVIAQGINRELIFKTERNKRKYYELLINNKEDFDVYILAYCIMNNHVHVLIYSDKIDNISKYMKLVNTSFAQYYNKINDRVGYVFRDRFKSQAIKNERYLYNCISYIHHNPVKANIVSDLDAYKYSSYNDYIRKTGIVNKKTLQLVFGGERDYIEMFNFIHYGEGEALEVQDETNITNCKWKTENLDRNELKEECKKLKELNFSNRKIAKMIGIDRNKVDRLLK